MPMICGLVCTKGSVPEWEYGGTYHWQIAGKELTNILRDLLSNHCSIWKMFICMLEWIILLNN